MALYVSDLYFVGGNHCITMLERDSQLFSKILKRHANTTQWLL